VNGLATRSRLSPAPPSERDAGQDDRRPDQDDGLQRLTEGDHLEDDGGHGMRIRDSSQPDHGPMGTY
jgi:hypothetical protein